MKNTIKKFLSVTFVVTLMLMSNVFAATTEELMFLDSTNEERAASRSGAYSYVAVKCVATYPTSGVDNLSYIESYIYRADRLKISNTYIITEGVGYKRVHIYEGYLNLSTVYLIFEKGTSTDCYAHVMYDADLYVDN